MNWTMPYPWRSRSDSVRRINMSREPGNESFFCALRPIPRILSLQPRDYGSQVQIGEPRAGGESPWRVLPLVDNSLRPVYLAGYCRKAGGDLVGGETPCSPSGSRFAAVLREAYHSYEAWISVTRVRDVRIGGKVD